jgi:hypothetical protein
MPPEPPAEHPQDEPDPKVLWRWVGAAVRPWIGWILVALGGLLMLFGYLGVSREAIPAKQLPYLISGGIGGIFFAVLGAYFLAVQELRNDSGRLDRLEEMVQELHLALLRRPDAPDVSAPPAAANGFAPPAREVVVVEGGEYFHRTTCTLVAGKDGEVVAPLAARRRSLKPCPVCTPAPAPAR